MIWCYYCIIMEHQNILNFLDNLPDQPSKFRTKYWFEKNDELRGPYNTVPSNRNEEVVFKNREPFTVCMSEIDNTKIRNAMNIDVVMNMYNLIEYREGYLQTSANMEIIF